MNWGVGGFEIVGEGDHVALVPKRGNNVGAKGDPEPTAVIALPPAPQLRHTPAAEHAPRQSLPLPITIIAPGTTVPVTARTQRAFRADRLTIVSSAGAASVVVISQFNVGADPQFAATGSLPIQMFSPTSFDNYIRASTATPGIEITLVLTHTAPLGAAETITGGFLGPAIVM